MQVNDWTVFAPEFMKHEFDCKETGENQMQRGFMLRLLALRRILGEPMVITSGFRSVKHSEEVKKENWPGWHTKGLACDVHIPNGMTAWPFVKLAMDLGFSIGVSQNPKQARFIHLDLRPGDPVLYSY